ncbi:class I SAM-dependent methyltransferase [Aliiglaciecola sp. M165]|uniref:class I SAM-dependent methyltransferase n=1 Tax=Aliiglaciecola sp. M165 TaxID=2593649 RepID=UPI0011807F51|nr:class I SAM-dependent methyltransferase [Aliiglaciecola sp. M165]TRY33392.1 class I SAM-dependent methyltransferase [Aliiglaciecola sp. M165]
MKFRTSAVALLATLGLAFSASSLADGHSIADHIKSAMDSDIRTDREKERDRNRRPVETLEFFGLESDMRIVELIPGGGWYTKLLAPAMAEKGEYFAAIGTGRIKDRLVGKPGFEKMKIVAEDAKLWREDGDRFYSLELDSLGVDNVDMVLTFRNYHNFNAQGRAAMNKAAFDALKSGGIYAVVDHTTRHMEPMNESNRRRVDPVLAIKEILAAGFEFVDYSDIHYREDDELEYEVGAKSVSGNTDRWTFKFRKP